MTPDVFSELVARVAPGAVAKSVLDTVQFRINGTTFATVNWPVDGWAVVKLSLVEQRRAMALSDAFAREPRHRRNSGVTLIRLRHLDEAVLAEVLAAAWRLAYRNADARDKPSAAENIPAKAG